MNQKTTANAGALAGLEEAPVAAPAPAANAGVDMNAIIAQVRAALAAEGNPEVEALKAKLAAAEAENAEMRKQKEATQLVDRHTGAANESHASSKQRFGIVLDESQDVNAIDPVFVQVNGRAYHIKRGRYVEVPREVVNVLTDAVQTATTPIKDAQGMPTGRVVVRNARRVPFQSFGEVINKDGVRIKEPQPETITE